MDEINTKIFILRSPDSGIRDSGNRLSPVIPTHFRYPISILKQETVRRINAVSVGVVGAGRSAITSADIGKI